MAVARERSRLVPLKAMPTDTLTPLANATIEIPPVITTDVIKPVSTMPAIALNRIFFWQSVQELEFHQKKKKKKKFNFIASLNKLP